MRTMMKFSIPVEAGNRAAARVKFFPMMNAQDLANAAPGIEKAVAAHGRE